MVKIYHVDLREEEKVILLETTKKGKHPAHVRLRKLKKQSQPRAEAIMVHSES